MPIAYSFEPHPAAFFRGATEGSLLALPERRAELLRAHGIARTVFASFDTDFAQQTPEQFMDRLRHELGAQVLVTGPRHQNLSPQLMAEAIHKLFRRLLGKVGIEGRKDRPGDAVRPQQLSAPLGEGE